MSLLQAICRRLLSTKTLRPKYSWLRGDNIELMKTCNCKTIAIIEIKYEYWVEIEKPFILLATLISLQ